MRRRSNSKSHLADDNNNFYRKRLRSWRQTSTTKPDDNVNNKTHAYSTVNDEIEPIYRSTIYTYPINLKDNNPHTSSSRTILSESAFYCPSISHPSHTPIAKFGDLNNNHVITTNTRKRKDQTTSCESLTSQCSQLHTFDTILNTNDKKLINPQKSLNSNLIHEQSCTKRTRDCSDIDNDSIITNHHVLNPPILIDDDTIDINQIDDDQPSTSSITNGTIRNNSSSMETAVKMVQPIVDIIFDAFEDQLKHAEIKAMKSSPLNSLSRTSLQTISPYQIYSPIIASSYPVLTTTRPIVLQAVNFNIQLTKKQSITSENSTNTISDENHPLQSISLTEFKQQLMTYILSNNLISNPRKRHKLKRIVQLAAFGVSVLCGYLFF